MYLYCQTAFQPHQISFTTFYLPNQLISFLTFLYSSTSDQLFSFPLSAFLLFRFLIFQLLSFSAFLLFSSFFFSISPLFCLSAFPLLCLSLSVVLLPCRTKYNLFRHCGREGKNSLFDNTQLLSYLNRFLLS